MLSRRGVVTALLLSAGAALTGCTSAQTSPTGSPTGESTDQLAATRAIMAAKSLTAPPGAPSGGPQPRINADHQAQLAVLGSAVGSPATLSAPTYSPARHVAAEWDAARAALADTVQVSPAMAVLLTQIAAVCGVHADLLATAYHLTAPGAVVLGPAGPGTSAGASAPASAGASSHTSAAGSTAAAGVTPSGAGVAGSDGSVRQAARQALATLVAGEHAMVYGYGVLTAGLDGAQAERARADWALHRSRRESYAALLRELSAPVPAAQPAYDLRLNGRNTALSAPAQFAGVLELRLLNTLIAAIAQTQGTLRQRLAIDAVATARRANSWSMVVPSLPGR